MKIVEHQLREYILLIESVKDAIPSFLLSLYFDSLGEFYRYQRKHKEAIFYYNQALKNNTSKSIHGLIVYHKGMSNITLKNEMIAMDMINEAKNVFDSELNYNRVLQCQYAKGIILMNIKEYDRALEIFHYFEYKKNSHIIDPVLLNANTVLINYFKGNYQNVINNVASTLEEQALKAFSYYKLNNIDLSKKALRQSMKMMDQASFEGAIGFIRMIRCIVYNSKESTFSNAMNMAKKFLEDEYRLVDLFYVHLVIEYYRKQDSLKYLKVLEELAKKNI